MTSRKVTLLSLLLGLFASLVLLGGCNSAEEEDVFLNVQVDSTWTRYDHVMVVLADSSGSALDTLFDGELHSAGQLRKLDGSGYDGGSIQVILIGYLGDKVAKRETRPFDGRTGLSGEKIIVVLIPLPGDSPVDIPVLDIQPDTATIYTGGPVLTLAPANGWEGDTLRWSSRSPEVATVFGGKLRAIAPGKAWIRAVSGESRDSSEITVVTDTPVLDAGPDTVVLPGDTLVFRIGVRQEFGVIDMFKWSLDGDTLWDDSSSGFPSDAGSLTTPSRTYSKVDTVSLRFYVRDGEGNAAIATRQLIVTDPELPVIASLRPGDTTVSIRDSIGFSARITSKVGLASFSWDFGDDGRAEVSGDLSDTAAALSTGRRYPDTGSFPVLLKVTDAKGGVATRRATVTVKLDLPVADAGRDTTVAAGTRINIHGKAADSLGKVVKTEWKIGSAAFAVASPDTGFTAPSSGQVILCVFRVTDDDGGVDMDTVRVTVSPSGNSALASLTASVGALSPAFAAGTLAYTVNTTDTVTTLTAALPAGSPATLKVNGAVVASGTASTPIRLPTGKTTQVPVVVTAQDGTTRTYTVSFIVGVASRPDLVITAAAITSKTATRVEYSYTLRNRGTAPVPDLFNVSIQNFYSADTIFNNAGDSAAGGAILGIRRALAAGDSLTGVFHASGAVPAGLRYLTFKIDWGDTLEESDENNNTAYRLVLVPPVAEAGADTTVIAASSIRLRGRASDPIGTVVKTEWKIGTGAYVTASPETTITAPALGGHTLVCLFRVTDDDGLVDEDTIRVTASVDADLTTLVPSVGTLSPAFARATTAYTLSVANSVTSMTLTPTAASGTATIRVNGVVVASGAASGNLTLAVGTNTLTVTVTAQSGLVKTYTVTATRAGSTVNTLQNLTATAGTLSPVFAAGTLSYTVNTTSATTTVTPTVTAGSGATVTVNGTAVASGRASAAISLPAGQTTRVEIAVRSQTGTTRTYSIAFNRSPLPDLVITRAAITSVTATGVTYSYTIQNAGGTTIPDLRNVSIQNFYSNDQVFNNAGDAAAGGSILNVARSLPPGESYSSTFQASGAPGTYLYLTWKIDWGEIVAESNETNNTEALRIP